MSSITTGTTMVLQYHSVMQKSLMRRIAAVIVACAAGAALLAYPEQKSGEPEWKAKESRLRNVKQLTSGGENAEAYFSFDGKRLVYQSTRDGAECDQMYTMNVDGTDNRRLSSGEGRTTCGFYAPDGRSLI